MRKSLTFNWLLMLVVSFTAYNVSAQELIWGGPGDPDGEFNGGLNNWTTTGLASLDPTAAANAVWVYKANGMADEGAFWGTLPAIASASLANGAAVFNSDYLDSDGIENPLGTGVAPAPHKGVLTSPVIDCSSFNSVAVQFTQFYRNYDATTSIEVTADGGATWTPFVVNSEVSQNGVTVNGAIKVVNISAVAANQPAVQFRFSFDGNYYFWIVDDVSLITVPSYDITMPRMYYSPSNFQTPKAHIARDTFFFAAELTNAGADDQTDVVLKAVITNTANNAVVYQDSVIIDVLPTSVVDSLFQIEDYYFPSELAVGSYRLTYSVYSANTDITPTDNTRNEVFNITDNLFSKDNGITGGLKPSGTPDFAFGNYFKMTDDPNVKTVALTTTFACAINSPDVMNGRTVDVFLIEINCADDFSDFVADTFYTLLDGSANKLIGANTYQFTTTDANYTNITVDLLDINSDPTVELKTGGKYFLVTNYAGADNNIMFHAVSNNIDYSYKAAVSPVWVSDQNQWFTQGFGADDAIAAQRMNVEVTVTSVDDIKALPESALSFFPNPAKGNVTVNVDLGTQKQGWLYVVDLSGKVLKTQDLQNAGQQTVSMDVNGLAAGAYLLRLSTVEGTRTMKLMVTE